MFMEIDKLFARVNWKNWTLIIYVYNLGIEHVYPLNLSFNAVWWELIYSIVKHSIAQVAWENVYVILTTLLIQDTSYPGQSELHIELKN